MQGMSRRGPKISPAAGAVRLLGEGGIFRFRHRRLGKFQRESEADHESMTRRACLDVGLRTSPAKTRRKRGVGFCGEMGKNPSVSPRRTINRTESFDSGIGGWAKLQRRSEADHETMTRGACLYAGLTKARRNKQCACANACHSLAGRCESLGGKGLSPSVHFARCQIWRTQASSGSRDSLDRISRGENA